MEPRLNRGWPNCVRQHRQTAESWILNIAPVGFAYRPKGEKEGQGQFLLLWREARGLWPDLRKMSTEARQWGLSNCSKDEAETSGKHSQENSAFTSTLTLGKQTAHISAHTLETQCRKTFTGNALEDIFRSIYFISTIYRREKGSPFWENIKIPTFLFLWSTDFDAELLHCGAERQFCAKTRNETILSDMHGPFEHTRKHTRYMANNQRFIQTHQQTAAVYEIWTHGSSSSRGEKKRKI